MKIFWFTNTVMPELANHIDRKTEVIGGWMSSLLDALRYVPNVEIAVASIDPSTDRLTSHYINGVRYFLLPLKRSKVPRLTPDFVEACTTAIKAFDPDIIHVHGTEDVYGLFTAQAVTCPTVISIQGLLHVYSRHVGGGITMRDAFDGGSSGVLSWFRFLLQESQWAKRGRVEKRIISENKHFAGRTDWDKSHVLSVNPAANCYHADEILRPPFFAAHWDLSQATRRTIFCTAAHSPLKGFHWLLYAVILLRDEFPDIQVRVAGAPWDESKGFGYYGRYIKSLIDKYNLSNHITSLPSLPAERVAEELRCAHIFVIPSLIENSPNSLAEAMLVGTPCVAAFVGGIPSMVSDGESALCYPPEDSAYLADCIRRLFLDDSLALNLSEKARLAAKTRHDPHRVSADLLFTYQQIVDRNQSRLQ